MNLVPLLFAAMDLCDAVRDGHDVQGPLQRMQNLVDSLRKEPLVGSGYYSDIIDFHTKFGMPFPELPHLLPADVQAFRKKFMDEELAEFQLAWLDRDLVKASDALVDLTYVVLGTAYMMGLPFNDLWDLVHAANMRKQRASSAEESAASTGRGHRLDVVKPPGWQSPEADERRLLVAHGAILNK